MNTEQKCPRCGQVMPPDAPAGHCPKCIVQLALEAVTVQTAPSANGPGTRSAGGQPVPSTLSRVKYFGDYELLEEIARGGMGVVWKARQASLNRPVAIKMILAGRFASEADVKRFHTEAEAAANLQHPNIVAIHEVGEYEGQHYFSMDYIEGKNLAELAREGPLPAAQAAALVKKIAEAIHYSHQRGTLHRDLKPSNVLIDAEGQPCITDFGLAKQLSQESGITRTGAVMGTPAYMPPEQASGKNDQAGPASDVYSIGAMLYHLLTGNAPFVEETPAATLQKVLQEEPLAPSKVNPKTPPDLETICLKCLEKRPDQRYHSARELAEELGRFLNHEPILARPASPWRKSWSWAVRHPWAIVGLASVVGLALLGLAYGLWEQVQYLEWKNREPDGGARQSAPFKRHDDVGRFMSDFGAIGVFGFSLLTAAVLYYQFLKNRKRWNLALGNLQLGLLAVGGLALIAIGLGLDFYAIRSFVWGRVLPSYTLLGFCLGSPLLFCWFGGIFVLQAVRWHQALWSGAATSDDLFEAQPLRSNPRAFAVVILVNVAFFIGLSHLAIPEGLYPEYVYLIPERPPYVRNQAEIVELLHIAPNVPYGLGETPDGHPKIAPIYGMLRAGFLLLAFAVSLAPRLYAARRVVPAPVSVFYWLFLVAGAPLSFSYFLPATASVMAVLAGLAGGWILLKASELRTAEPAEHSSRMRARELFAWDAPAFARTLIGVAALVLVLGMLFFRRDLEKVLVFALLSGFNALWPMLVLACRKTAGSWRELFLWLIPLLVFLVGLPIGGLIAGAPWAANMLTAIPVGCVAGWLLLHFGKIRPKAC